MPKIIPILIMLLVLMPICVVSEITPDQTAGFTRVLDVIDRNQAETIKSIQDNNKLMNRSINENMDSNIKQLDDSISKEMKNQIRDVSIVIVCAFVGAFAVSQIIRLKVEEMRRRDLIQKAVFLMDRVNSLEVKQGELKSNIFALQSIKDKYSKEIENLKASLKPKNKVITSVMFLIVGVLVGGVGMYLILQGVF
jgi:hypothetical protein